MQITTEMLSPLTEGITSNMGILVPVGLGIMATFVGVRMIPKVVHWFIG